MGSAKGRSTWIDNTWQSTSACISATDRLIDTATRLRNDSQREANRYTRLANDYWREYLSKQRQ